MPSRYVSWILGLGLIAATGSPRAEAQAPVLPTELPQALPGAASSTLGAIPGSGGATFSDQAAGGGAVLGGRPGASVPRVPTSISVPGGNSPQPASAGVTPIPAVRPLTEVPLYGSLDLPIADDDGPADGLTFDQALDRMLRANLDLLARRFEIPSAQADVLTAGLRANPIFYADSQLVPYGEFTKQRPGGQTQYDVNISHPIDFSGKRRSRKAVAVLALKAVEAQYQDAVRVQIANLANAYLAVLAARETVRYIEAGQKGLDRVLTVAEALKIRGERTSSDVGRFLVQRESATVGLRDANRELRRAKRTLGALLAMTPAEAEAIEINASLRDQAPPPPLGGALTELALRARPDLVAYRFGVPYAAAGLRLQQANRYADAYLLLQPYTFQNNSPNGLKSSYSWAVGLTVPLPLYNRNQGNIERARINIQQTKVQLQNLERQVMSEVSQAEDEYQGTQESLERLGRSVIPASKQALEDTRKLFTSGEKDVTLVLDVQREYNDVVRLYRDTAVRHRRSMAALNTAVGTRILP